ncbi:MAG: prepilin-type N-terminal cleavage/methylation domain-containing protein [Candidatus Yanofskybacteria bacterium]|nr:prepilin-type N-terminal cleavage/methylation domain-containing protein [Candidatus Yanofskybacteria bacterium]
MKIVVHKKGFTLIEALVALVLLTMTLGPILYFASSSADIATSVINNVIAANLAQEGVEVIRAIRDSNYFAEVAFDTGLPAGTFEVQWDSQPPLAATIGIPQYLKIDSTGAVGTTGLYNYGSGIDTPFIRLVTITKVSAIELKITSSVTWTERSRNRSVEVEDHLYDWK